MDYQPENYPSVSESVKGLRLASLLPDISEILVGCEQRQMAPMSALQLVLGSAWRRRQTQRQEMQLKMARFPTAATLENFDFSNIDSYSAKLVAELSSCDWIERHENALFKGASGLGKTHLAIALGKRAVAKGYRTLFIEANTLFKSMRMWNQSGELEDKLKNLAQVKFLIIDDIGYTTDPHPGDAMLFYSLINGRYCKCSTLITSNRPLQEWLPALSADATCMRAAADRFVHLCHIVKLTGKSYRLQEFRRRSPNSAASDAELIADGSTQAVASL